MKTTFKKNVGTGRYASFTAPSWDIKVKKQRIGLILGSSSYTDLPPYKVRFAVVKKDINEDGNTNCKWKWITLQFRGSTIEETKQFVVDKIDTIYTNYDIPVLGGAK